MEIMKSIKGGHGGCSNCGEQLEVLPLETVICVGFGYAALEKDKEVVFCEDSTMELDECMTVSQAEELAMKEPDSDWRIHLVAPLSERHYQRQGVGKWVLYEKGQGFA
jgi:hypothetical protein